MLNWAIRKGLILFGPSCRTPILTIQPHSAGSLSYIKSKKQRTTGCKKAGKILIYTTSMATKCFAIGRQKERIICWITALLFLFVFSPIQAQTTATDPQYKIVVPGKEYAANSFHRWLWGSHYRQEWTTPVKVPVIRFDTVTTIGADSVAPTLTPTEQGGGRQTKTLRLETAKGKQYVLRTIDKSFSAALPEITRGTFVEKLANDQVSIAHPFAPVTIPVMAKAAGVYHTNPHIVYVAPSDRLGEYNKTFANTLCLFEERPDNDQSDAVNFGNSEKVVSTAKMMQKVMEENDHKVDQKAFVRARLFDMFIGDWGRHEDQWRWARFDSAGYVVYKPIPRDRDQAFTKFDGFFPYIFTSPEQLEHLQSFDYTIKNIKKYNFPARYLDRRFTNNISKSTWMTIAKSLQQSLTDSVIEEAIHQLPPEEFSISGKGLIAKLKSRRNHLVHFAEKYYKFLSKEVDIVGSEEREWFDVNRLDDNQTSVTVYRISKKGNIADTPYYHRIFNGDTTHEIRLYGLSGSDIYTLNGKVDEGIKIRIIGGTDSDSLIDRSTVSGLGHKTLVYDNPGNHFITSSETKLHLSADTAINEYNYKAFQANSGHTIKTPWYSTPIGFYVALGYVYQRQQWRKEPFAWQQKAYAYYSISQNSLGAVYDGIFNQVIGKWNLALHGGFDGVRQGFFFGVGNESANINKSKYYQLHSREAYGSAGLQRPLGPYNTIAFTGFYQGVQILNRSNHFITDKWQPKDQSVFDWKHFAGGRFDYALHTTNDIVVPTKGIDWLTSVAYTLNINDSKRSFTRYSSNFTVYVPLINRFSLAIRAGAATITGTPEFYQLNTIGGGSSLRGFRRNRFYGKTSFYNGNELRWITDIRSYYYNGKIGLIAFVDDGRVWQPGEVSDKWHIGYGGGLMIAPFNRISASVFYGISKESKIISLRLGNLF